jgi:hypothetical protein
VIKLYKRGADGRLSYHEAWEDGGKVVEHWGVVGTRGDSKTHSIGFLRRGASRIAAVLAPARSQGFADIDEAELRTVIVEYAVVGMGNEQDLEKRYAVQARMDETLGWTGLGHCDGGSIGSGTMEVCCLVVDVEIAKQVIADDLAGTAFADFVRIYDEDVSSATISISCSSSAPFC